MPLFERNKVARDMLARQRPKRIQLVTLYEIDLYSRSAPMPDATPIVFIVDDDISVRESLELMIRSEGWKPATFASAQEFLAAPKSARAELFDSRRESSGPQRTRSAKTHRRRPDGYADHLHHGLRRRADVRASHESGRRRIFDEAVQRRSDVECLARCHSAKPWGVGTRDGFAQPAQPLRDAQRPRARSHGLGRFRPHEQAGRRQTRHQRDHGEGAPGKCDAQNGGRIIGRSCEHGCRRPGT
jgi:hypothetical protein